MITRKSTGLLIVMLFLIAPIALMSAEDPFTGTWKLNLSKSKLPPPVPITQTGHIKAGSDAIQIREEIVNEKGETTEVSVSAKFDGKEYPVHGSPFADSVIYDRVDSYTIKGIAKKAGKEVSHETAVISKDGKTMTVNYYATDPTGKPVAAMAVFELVKK